jgi:molybdopterin-guanine dinucleotide biosynthesis protein A
MLLVGGESRRMGTDKATLVVAGEPLWQRQVRLLRELDPEAIWISARSRPAWCPTDIELVLDEPPSRGPLSGLAAALSRLQTSHLLALAIDMPQMTVMHLKKLLTFIEPGCGVVPANGDLFEPLCAVYPAEASSLANRELQQGRLVLQHLVEILRENKHITTYRVADPEKRLYQNANTPSQL